VRPVRRACCGREGRTQGSPLQVRSDSISPEELPMAQTLSAAPTVTEIEQVPLLSGGKWIKSSSSRLGDVYNPSTGKVIAKVPFSSTDEVNKVIEAAAAAGPEWASKLVVQRCHFLF